MLFCSSESNSGAACASVNESGDPDPFGVVRLSLPIPCGRCEVTYQNPPTRSTIRNKRRNRISFQTFPRHLQDQKLHEVNADILEMLRKTHQTLRECNPARSHSSLLYELSSRGIVD